MVIIKNKRMIFSEEDRYVGTRYDSSTTTIEFRLYYDDNIDWWFGALTFNLIIRYSDTNETDILAVVKGNTSVGTDGTAVKELSVTFTETALSHSGTHLIQLVGLDSTGRFKWSSYQSFIYIEDALNAKPISVTTLSLLEAYEAQLTNKLLLLQATEDQVVLEEANRKVAETARADAETARVAAEVSRVDAETARVEAESSRADAETARVTAETARAAAEAARVEETTELMKGYAAASLKAESYAVGSTGTREGEDTDNAKYYASLASTSEVNAAASEADALEYAKNASSSEAAAAKSATKAAASETAAAASETNAAKSESTANGYANDALNSKTAAASSATAAAASQTAAADSATTASTAATTATEAATNASKYKDEAFTATPEGYENVAAYATQGVIIDDDGYFYALVEEG